jgi:FtsP/CotA-like multicopper oxidase with cupredoxin domain
MLIMPDTDARREFLKCSTLGAAGLFLAGTATVSTNAAADESGGGGLKDEYDGFSRLRPSRGNDPDSPFYLGKEVPGYRNMADGPAPFVAPDLDRMPHRMHSGAKEFHLVCQPVKREFLPGYSMNVYGFNGSMPGPTIEVTQGDRVRFVVTNESTEDTVVHWHGFELPVQYDGSDTLTQNSIKPGKTFVYEFDVHEEGTFFYHSHVPMQEAFGMVGWLIVHPKKMAPGSGSRLRFDLSELLHRAQSGHARLMANGLELAHN